MNLAARPRWVVATLGGRLAPEHEPEGVTVSNRRVLVLIIAIAIAGLTALATFNYAQKADQRALGNAKLVSVFVVKKDIVKGLPGEKALDEGYIAKEDIPKKFYPANAVVDAQS